MNQPRQQRGSIRPWVLVTIFLAVAIAAAATVFWVVTPGGGDRGGVAAIGGPFELVDQNGRTVTEKSWPGKYLLVYFGYTFCPDVCPTELSTMAAALDELGGDADKVQPLFITVDPERDTVPVMADYVPSFHPRLQGLTGSDAQVRGAAKAYRVYFAKGKDEGDGAYLMDHSSFIYLIDPEGNYVTHFSPMTAPEEMARRIRSQL
jgi:protein SCO1/2